MPNYDYRCLDCGRRFSLFISYQDYGKKPAVCQHCSSENVQRRIGKVRIARPSGSRMDDFSNPESLEGLDEDPRAMAKMMREMRSEMGSEMGEDLGPEFDEVVDRLEKGQSPEEIEQALPDLGGEDLSGEMDYDD